MSRQRRAETGSSGSTRPSDRAKAGEVLKLILALAVYLGFMHFSGIGCPIRFVTGIPCAGCGMSRALLSLFTGHPGEAVRLHPMVVLMPPAALVWLFREHFPRRVLKLLTALTVLLFLGTYACRLALHDPVLEIDISGGLAARAAGRLAELF